MRMRSPRARRVGRRVGLVLLSAASVAWIAPSFHLLPSALAGPDGPNAFLSFLIQFLAYWLTSNLLLLGVLAVFYALWVIGLTLYETVRHPRPRR